MPVSGWWIFQVFPWQSSNCLSSPHVPHQGSPFIIILLWYGLAVGISVIYIDKNIIDHNFFCYLHDYVIVDMDILSPSSEMLTQYSDNVSDPAHRNRCQGYKL